ncbi:MAG: MMPL family transporter, partial [Hydrocarboniphaga effusa]|nr:MMPL family transporter [Hydrocarboniphaga effusa]
VEGNPLLRGHLVSADGRSSAIAVALEAQTDREILESGITDAIIAAADRERGVGVQVWVTGAPVIRAATSRAVLGQLRWAVPAVALLLVAVLGLAFRNLRGVLLPLATIVIALAWTLAVLRWLDRPLNLITSLVPPLLVTMGLAYCAHVISEFESILRKRDIADARARVVLLLKEITAPVLLTGFTTGLGLLALALNNLPAVREFAWLSALGVLFSALLTLTLVPAALCFARPRLPPRALPGDRLFEQGSEKLARFDLRHRRGILLAAAAIFALCTAAATRIQVGDQFVGIFPEDSRVRSDYDAVNRAFGGVNPLAIVIDGGPEAFTDPAVLRQLERMQHWLAGQPEVGAVSGLVDHVILFNTLFAGEKHEVIPDSGDLIRQLLFFGYGPTLAGAVNSDRSSSLIELRLRVDDTAAIAAFMQRLQAQLALLSPPLTARITGNAALLATSVERVTAGQLQSIGLALLLIYLCLAVQFASWSVALKASLPTFLQTALYFGALGVSGIPLNATTSLVECLVLGLAVDDTIHYLARFNKAAKRSGSEGQGAAQALSAVLRP